MNKYPMVKLVDCINIFNNPITKFNGKKKYVATGDLLDNHINYEKLEEFDYNNKPSRANLTANVGDILFAKMKNTKKTFIISHLETSYMFSTGFFCITPKDIIDKKYLFHIVNNDIFLSQKDIYCTGATQKALTLDGLKKIIIPLPPIEEQRHIAEVLDKVTAQIDNCKKILQNWDLLVKSKFVQMFGNVINNSMNWNWKKIKDFAKIVSGSTPKTDIKEYWDGSIIWITPAEIDNNVIYVSNSIRHITKLGVEKTNLTSFPKNTIILSSRAPIGKVAIANCEMYCNQGFKNLICDNTINPIYMYFTLKYNTNYLNSLGRGATFKEISKSIVENIQISVPPIELQNQFAEFVEKVEKQKTTTQNTLNQLETLKNALMQEYFS